MKSANCLSNLKPESIEGLDDNWIIYRLKATIVRGLMQKEEITRKNVRIVRTLGPTDLDSTIGMLVGKSVQHDWAGKVRYTISVPSIAFAYGASIEVRYCFSHLLKGCKVERVITRLMEAQLLTSVGKDGSQGQRRYTRVIAEDDYRKSPFFIDTKWSYLSPCCLFQSLPTCGNC